MTSLLVARHAVLLRRIEERPDIEIWAADLDGQEVQAVVYPALTGKVLEGDRVLLNTTAMELQLGTGGQHFVLCGAKLGAPVPPAQLSRDEGHIMKLRYTPLQFRVMAAEEQSSPYHDVLHQADRLPGTPVICLGLHSQLAPAVGGIKAANPQLRVAYVMTDSAALPLAYSQLVNRLKNAGLLDLTVSAGQAFGGDLEAVNLYSALVTAAVAGKADVIVAGQGPGNVGTDTPLGFGGIEQAMLLNAAGSLAGRAIAVPRISFADPRARHHGISHHSLTVLDRLTLVDVTLPLPTLTPAQSDIVQAQLQRDGLRRHQVRMVDGEAGIIACQQAGIPLRSMGRDYDADPAFFQSAAAAGRLAAEMLG